MVGNYCNFSCWYCGPHANGGTHRWHEDTEFLIKNFRHMFDFFMKNGKTSFELNLLGGEPALWPDVAYFSKEIKRTHPVEVTMTTNGSRTLRWWDQNADAFDKIRFSCHPNEVDVDHYISVLDLVFSKGISMNALVLMDPTNWDRSVEIIEKCKKSKYPWFLNAVEVFSQYQYTEEQRQYIAKCVKRRPSLWWILKHDIKSFKKPRVVFEDGKSKYIERNFLSLNDLNHFRGWSCNVGLDNINIQKDGILTGTCNMKLYGEDFYYNIYDLDFVEKFNPELKPVICEVDNCWCQPEQLLDKKKVFTKVQSSSKEYPLHMYTNLEYKSLLQKEQ
jgi:MoaA/NifB/PqqE/SkfB family radical SAM enzyme